MKLAVIGSRGYEDYNQFKKIIERIITHYNVTEFVSGGARGADRFAEDYAKEFDFPIIVLVAQWEKYGRSAGFRRNHDIWEEADMGIAFWDGKSKGTEHSFKIIKEKEKNLVVFNYKDGIISELNYSKEMEEW